MAITYDPKKDKLNRKNHKISLREAAKFDWDAMDLRPGEVDESGETREEGLGYIGEHVYFVVLKERGEDLHIISLRRATASEAMDYETKFFAK